MGQGGVQVLQRQGPLGQGHGEGPAQAQRLGHLPGASRGTGCSGSRSPAGIPTALISPVVLWGIWRSNLQ